jgi:hypothetical protein
MWGERLFAAQRETSCRKDGKEAMNAIETLRDDLKKRFPGGTFTITPGTPRASWTLDIVYNGKFYTVDWTPPDRFGVSSASDDSAFGGGPDEVFSNVDDLLKQLVRFLTKSVL